MIRKKDDGDGGAGRRHNRLRRARWKATQPDPSDFEAAQKRSRNRRKRAQDRLEKAREKKRLGTSRFSTKPSGDSEEPKSLRDAVRRPPERKPKAEPAERMERDKPDELVMGLRTIQGQTRGPQKGCQRELRC